MEEYTRIKGTDLHYNREGSGPDVIIMHGWGCTSATMKLFEQVASANHTVWNLDMPGFGASPEPSEVWGVGDYTAMLEEFVKAKGIKRPVVVGHSFGGRVAILYASRNDVDRLVLVDAAGVKPRRSLKYYWKVYTFKAGKHIAKALLPEAKAEALINRWRGRSGSSDYAGASPRMRQIMSRVVNEDLRFAMPSIKAPTLLLWGERDTATPMRDARIMERLIPDAGLVSFPDAGHFSFVDEPARTRAIFSNFINS